MLIISFLTEVQKYIEVVQLILVVILRMKSNYWLDIPRYNLGSLILCFEGIHAVTSIWFKNIFHGSFLLLLGRGFDLISITTIYYVVLFQILGLEPLSTHIFD